MSYAYTQKKDPLQRYANIFLVTELEHGPHPFKYHFPRQLKMFLYIWIFFIYASLGFLWTLDIFFYWLEYFKFWCDLVKVYQLQIIEIQYLSSKYIHIYIEKCNRK